MASEPNGAPAPNKPRKFAPVPVEETTRSFSKGQDNGSETVQQKDNTSRWDVKQVEDISAENTKAPTPRRFAPEPVETSTRSRRKLPEPVETTAKSSRGGADSKEEPSGDKPRRKFMPEAVETTTRRRGGRRSRSVDEEEDEDMADVPSRQSSIGSTSSGARKFTPELVETVRGSYRRRTPYGHSPENPSSPLNGEFRYKSRSRSPKTPRATSPRLEDSRFSAASLAKRQEKRHSFIVPDLPSIPSDSSEGSTEETSGATSPSNLSAGAAKESKTVRTKTSGEQLSQRIFDLAAKVAERQLRDQALAAFPNERFNQPVDHYALEDDEEEETDKPGKLKAHGGVSVSRFRRDSAADLDLELSRMRNHHNELERIEEEIKNKARATGDSPFSAAALAAKKGIDMKKEEEPAKAVGRWQKDVGLAQMKNAASPPMLGGDIKFPMSLSPKHTRCDPDQIPVPRRQDSDGDVQMDDQHLWSPKVSVQNSKDAGLWMGSCARDSNPPTPVNDYRRSGLMTPAVETGNPFDLPNLPMKEPSLQQSLFMNQLPLTPATSRTNPSMDNIDRMLEVEKHLDEEFNDAFVTQIYNYLSLGYPSLAHPFDDELSKISRIEVEDLRKDDHRTNAKGYVGAPEGDGVEEQEVLEGKCARWTALRLYIKEWARQQPNMSERVHEDWGARARRGSWAI